MRTRVVLGCLVGCCLFCFSLCFAETPSEVPGNGADNDAATADTQPQGTVGGGATGRAKPTATATAPAAITYTFPSNAEMNRYWLKSTLGPKAFVGATFTASWNQWIADSPSEWAKDATGWGQRFGSAFLDNGINTTSLVWISRVEQQDPRYRRCECTGFKPRFGHALKLTFYSYNRNGGLSFSAAKVISPVTGPLVTRNTVYPDRFSGAGDAFGGYAYYFAGGFAWNVIREFVWNLR
jgi:hypothetical protein